MSGAEERTGAGRAFEVLECWVCFEGSGGCGRDSRLLDLGGDIGLVTAGNFSVPATGNDKPRSLPLLATPFPHVNCVLYPPQSFPSCKHLAQYGLRRSHAIDLLVHVKQSAGAPGAKARFLLLRGAFAVLASAAPRSDSSLGPDMLIATISKSV